MKPKSVGRAGGQTPHTHPIAARAGTAGTKVGFVSGTILLTQDGEIPVEYLSPGDRIITRDAGMVTLNRINRRRTVARAISFAAGSLGHTRPDKDLILPGGQMVLIRDWRAQAMSGRAQTLIRADALVDGEFICDLGPQRMQLYMLQFDTPHVVYAGGLELPCTTDQAARLRPAA